MGWSDYAGILLRRWWIVALIVVIAILAGAYRYRQASRQAGYQACSTLYVADLAPPNIIVAPGSNTLDVASQALAGETAANFFGDDMIDIAQSRSVASYISGQVNASRSAGPAPGFQGAVSGSRLDRTIDLCVSNPNGAVALAGAKALDRGMTADRKRFLGPMAKRIYTRVISAPQVSAISTGHAKLTFLLEIILGIIVAVGAAFLWDALDPRVRGARDVEDALRVPVLTSS